MTTHEQYGLGDESTVHEAVGAYVLGILDDAEATAFEAHLAGCRICAVHLEEFSGMEQMLAMLGDQPDSLVSPIQSNSPVVVPLAQLPTPSVSVQPSPQLLGRLVDEVAVKRAKRKRRGLYLVAAAAVLIVGAPVGAVVATSGNTDTGNIAQPQTPADSFQTMAGKVEATDPTSGISATVATVDKVWGTETMAEIRNVKGPLDCRLVVVSKAGEQQVIGSWSVPERGYGIPDSPTKEGKQPLYVQGGTSVETNNIDHFEIQTLDGSKRLVTIPGA
ncbi:MULTISPECIES: anti-sigma factor family protein [unclassified Streptomyces]|uniref:anti-sigma factor family protein n=1 Tax=unclassified Streptomyces TaxID=2593676 RepID=UPI00380733B2